MSLLLPAARTSAPSFAFGRWPRARLAMSLVALSGGITGCDGDKIERFKRFCAERSTVEVVDPAAWRDYVRLVRSADPEFPSRLVLATERYGYDVAFAAYPSSIARGAYVPNDVTIKRGARTIATIKSFTFGFQAFEGARSLNCATSFPEQYKI